MSIDDLARLFDQSSDHRLAASAMSSPDLDRYRPYVAHLDIPEARKDDMILAVWRIMRNTVDRAFGDDPVQRSRALADKSHDTDECTASSVIDLHDTSSSNVEQILDDVFYRYATKENNEEEKR